MAESLLFEQLREKADGLERENERLREEVQRLSELVGSKQLQIENLKNQIERNESDEEEVDIAPPRLGDQPIEHNQIHEEEIEVVEMIPKCIKEMLKPHQIEGINFLRSILKGKRVRLSKVCAKLALIAKIGQKFLNASKERSIRNFGCILADCMGLGKTLQLLVALYLFMAEESYSRKYRIIIIVPLNVSLHWIHEIEKLQRWIALDDSLWQLPAPYFMDSTLNLAMRRYVLKEWNFKGGIMVLGYEMCREIMSDPEMVLQPDVICLDEGHRIKNLHSSISETLSSFSTQRRIILSGYPLQNNLCELYSMLYFVSPRITTLLFGSLKRFEHVFVKKIRFWQISTKQEEREKAKKWSCVLRHALESSSLFLRRSISIISAGLPPKTEFILRVGLDPKQRDLYIRYLCRLMDESSENPSVFRAFSLLSMVCDHPFIPKKMHLDKGSEPNSVLKYTLSRTWISEEYDFLFQKALAKSSECMYRYSGKMIFLLNLLIECKKHNEKVIVFSRWLHALSLVEDLLMSYNSKLRDSDSYKKFRFRRFDGSTGIEDRKCIISQLTPTNPQEIDVLILSTLCGEGINLSEASRVVIMDVNWNPNHDLQAALRVFRYGQTRPIFIYRLVSDDTMEQKVFFRQMHKVELSNWIVDESTNSLVETSMDSNSLKQLFLKPVKNDCLTSEVAYCIEAVNDSITRSALNESTYHLNGRSYSWISSCEVFDSFFETERVEDSPEHDLLNTLEEIHWHVTYDRKSDKINSSRDRNPDLKSRVRSSSSSDLDTISMTPRKRATEAEAFRRK